MLSSGLSLIVCFFILIAASVAVDNEGDIRLVGSDDKWQGRVELFHNKTWGTICDDYWDINYAKVVCRQLGFSDALVVYLAAQFGQGKDPIQLDRLRCFGNESKILDCDTNGWNHHYCDHTEDVGVSCLHQGSIPSGGCTFDQDFCGYTNAIDDDFDWTRRSKHTPSWNTGPAHDHTTGNGSYIYIETSSPRVQGQMARIVSPQFKGARCIQFYYNMKGKTVNELSVYVDDGLQRTVVWQNKNETKVWSKATFPVKNVGDVQIVFEALVGVSYLGDIAIDDVSPLKTSCSLSPPGAKPELIVLTNASSTIRLVDGNVSSAGRIEVLYKGRWGSICGTHFHLPAAKVVCKQLGYLDVETIVPCCLFNPGKGMIWLDNLHCEGRERSITLCPHKGWGITTCAHNRDVGVICKTKSTLRDIRLTGSTHNYEGRVEVKVGGIWGTIMDYGFDIFDSTVVCKQLNFSGASSAYNAAHFGMGQGPIWFSNARCQGNETSLWQCNMTQHRIQWNPRPWWHWKPHSKDASVVCYDLRLAGGKSAMEGRLEIRYLGVWGTICNQFWDANAATVACRNLGYAGYTAMKVGYSLSKPADGHDPILKSVSCKGDEAALGLCGYDLLLRAKHSCTHDNDVILVCNGTNTNPTSGPGPVDCDSSCPGTCYRTIKHGGVCICPEVEAVTSPCDAIGSQVSEASFTKLKYHQFNPDDFKSRLRDQLNGYCKNSKICPGVNNGSRFEIQDITIMNGWPLSFHDHLDIRFVALIPVSQSRALLPRSLIIQMTSTQSNKLAGYDVLMTRKPINPKPHPQKGSSSNTVKIVVPIVVIVTLLGVGIVIYFIYKRRSAFGTGGGGPASQRYLHLSPDDHHDQDDPLLSMEDDQPTTLQA